MTPIFLRRIYRRLFQCRARGDKFSRASNSKKEEAFK